MLCNGVRCGFTPTGVVGDSYLTCYLYVNACRCPTPLPYHTMCVSFKSNTMAVTSKARTDPEFFSLSQVFSGAVLLNLWFFCIELIRYLFALLLVLAIALSVFLRSTVSD